MNNVRLAFNVAPVAIIIVLAIAFYLFGDSIISFIIMLSGDLT